MLGLLALALHTAPVPPAAPPAEAQKFFCNTHLLRSYLLKGRFSSTGDEPHLTCPDIKQNCCTKFDQQRIYHFVNDIFTRRFDEYTAKLLAALTKFRNFHNTVTKTPLTFRGSINRRYYCARQTQRLHKFPFQTLYDNLVNEIEAMAIENREFHQRFFCILCDAENHRFFEFDSSRPQIIFDLDFCKQHLQARSVLLKLINVDFQEYLMNLQNVVDCRHYAKSYSLKFYDGSKVERANLVDQCLTYLDTKEFFRYCKPICQKVKLSKVFEEAEGDLQFWTDTLSAFEESFNQLEDGFVASSIQKNFFAKTLKKGGKAARELREAAAKTMRNELEDGVDSELSLRMRMRNAVVGYNKQMQKRHGKTAVKAAVKRRPQERRLLDFDTGYVSQTERVLERQAEDDSPQNSLSGSGRVLAASSKSAASLSKATPVKPMYDGQIAPFYNEIVITPPTDANYVCPLLPPPIDFETPLKAYQINLGVNPLKYTTLNFTMSREDFYNRLFKKVRKEKMNPQIQFLLADFTASLWEDTVETLVKDYTVNTNADRENARRPEERTFLDRFIGLFIGVPWSD